ncbi:prolipoprotein diacylglyceryl transferase [Roseovarius rhodophyticola]|uniref:Phosphatidylglycerol--prolipoprotein diacylglyceryl transferase n=1 Tax=Roseovarius rhodophyticola TaxID=3080827 RepID=A0ABZ2TGB6_9RHOB|nr:prolipoprotein diacylglyceryl transferase [Roseovarius sp. W115]MDV2929048.1 prolipoprotein diacylglyceryl transferase [Roseovarius sp. W115]
MRAAIPFPEISSEAFSFTVFGYELALRWYALSYIVGIIIGWWLVAQTVKRAHLWANDTAPMSVKQVEDLATWVILGVILGGRLGFVLFYQPAYYLANPSEILMVWQGGMSFHGGLIGVIIACVAFSKRNGIPWLSVADVLCMVTPVGLLLGRLANFTNAELWGRPTEVPWGVIFPGAAAQDCAGVVAGLCARHPSQLYEAFLEGLLLFAVLVYLGHRRGALKKVGAITGLFFIGYGLGRFLVEFVRQPDAQFISPGNPLGLAWHINGYGLTMGQILCIPMIIFGAYMLARAQRRARTAVAE